MSQRHLRPLLLAVSTATALGCSSPDHASGGAGGGQAASNQAGAAQTGGTASGGGQDGTSDGVNAGSSGQQPSAGAAGTASSGGQASSGHTGQMLLQNMLSLGHSSMSASFIDSQSGGPNCTSTVDGNCSVSECDTGTSTTKFASAGTLTVTSSDVTGSATLTPAADGSYSMPQITFAKQFTGQEHTLFAASGGDVPAFQAPIDVPLLLLVSEPVLATGATVLDADRTQDLSFTWTRGVTDVVFYVNGASQRGDGQPGFASLTCQFESTLGTGMVKASLLQKLNPDTELQLYTVRSQQQMAGSYAVTLALLTQTATPDKHVIYGVRLH